MSKSRPGFRARRGIYLFDDPIIAEDWAGLATEEGFEKGLPVERSWTILEVVVPEKSRLFWDPDFDRELFGARYVVRRIPPECIRVFRDADVSAYLGYDRAVEE
jgi:hypothetical protein